RLAHQRPPYARSLASLGVEEDGRARQAPVDERGHRHPRELAWPRCLGVGCLWPVDLYAVAAGDEEQSFAGGGGAEVGGDHLVEVALIALVAQQVQEARPGLAPALRIGHQVLPLHRHALAWLSYTVHRLAGD